MIQSDLKALRNELGVSQRVMHSALTMRSQKYAAIENCTDIIDSIRVNVIARIMLCSVIADEKIIPLAFRLYKCKFNEINEYKGSTQRTILCSALGKQGAFASACDKYISKYIDMKDGTIECNYGNTLTIKRGGELIANAVIESTTLITADEALELWRRDK